MLLTIRPLLPAVLAALFASAPVAAGPKQCVAAHEKAVSDYQEGRLKAAKETARECALDSCPKVVRGECLSLLEKIAADQPTIVPAATDASGGDLVDVKVFVDDAEQAARLDGRAFDVEPGQRSVRFETPDGESRTVQVLIKQGEKNRRVIARFERPNEEAPPAPPAAPEPDPKPAESGSPGAPAGAWIAGGVGVLALGSFGYFALSGKSEQRDLEDRCAPACTKDEYRDMKRQFLFADISLGVAALSFGVATWLFLAPRGETPRSEVSLGVAPGSARLDWRGRF